MGGRAPGGAEAFRVRTVGAAAMTMTGETNVRVRSGSAGAGLRKLSVEVHEDDLRQITVSLVCGDQHSPNPLLFVNGARRPLVLVAGTCAQAGLDAAQDALK